jgi:hypothetical protein
MSGSPPGDYFERARAIAGSVLFAAATAAIIGSILDWVIVAQEPPVVPTDQLDRLPPFTGLEVGDGWFVIAAAVVVLLSAFFIVMKAKLAWLAFFGSVIIGGIAISDYRGIADLHLELEGIGRDPAPGLGLTLVAAAGVIALIASVAAIAASPSQRETGS